MFSSEINTVWNKIAKDESMLNFVGFLLFLSSTVLLIYTTKLQKTKAMSEASAGLFFFKAYLHL